VDSFYHHHGAGFNPAREYYFTYSSVCTLLPTIIAINRKVGLKKAPSCLNFIASIIKNLPDNENGEKRIRKAGKR